MVNGKWTYRIIYALIGTNLVKSRCNYPPKQHLYQQFKLDEVGKFRYCRLGCWFICLPVFAGRRHPSHFFKERGRGWGFWGKKPTQYKTSKSEFTKVKQVKNTFCNSHLISNLIFVSWKLMVNGKWLIENG